MYCLGQLVAPRSIKQFILCSETELNKFLMLLYLLINNNIDEFKFGVDILDLKSNGTYQVPFQELGFSNRDITISKNIYLLSEQGYFICFLKDNKTFVILANDNGLHMLQNI